MKEGTKEEKKTRAKLDEEKVFAIRSMKDSGFTHKEIAALFNVSRSTVGYILSGRSWRNVK